MEIIEKYTESAGCLFKESDFGLLIFSRVHVFSPLLISFLLFIISFILLLFWAGWGGRCSLLFLFYFLKVWVYFNNYNSSHSLSAY